MSTPPLSLSSSAPLTPRSDPLASSFATTYAGVVAFIAVVAEGSFARAADRLGIGRSAVSRSVQRLEDQLNVRLFLRTTRSTTLTREGDIFYAGCHTGVDRIVQAVDEMKDLREGPPRGHLRISSAVGFGRKVVAPLLADFQLAYPDVTLELVLSDKPTDFITDRVDIEFRNGRIEDAQIIARQIIPMQLLVCASPAYRRTHGLPATVDELARHHCINFRHASSRIAEWEFKVDGQMRKLTPGSRLTYNDGDLVLQAVLNGQGIAQLPGYQICGHLRGGTLVSCLAQHAPDDRGHYICYLSRQHLPTRMRAFIDFAIEKIRAADLQCAADLDLQQV
ncbi:LysR family transcriptional regulator [Variovorax sp. JS1663]|uniref:LysR family transcriptional regulator n=1 Tax=Variovorax sp. JS1663 TaxID=1851577 RepID=UPI000B34919A|nr:LysR family transcriptional regulator [Variovorax sp. JS1663]OUL99786.1 LysR family transcriptional regulator [Variovorax sp. JS1663]